MDLIDFNYFLRLVNITSCLSRRIRWCADFIINPQSRERNWMKLHKMGYVTKLNQPWYSSKQNKTFIFLNLGSRSIYKLEFEFIIIAFPVEIASNRGRNDIFSLQQNTPRCYRRTAENESICFFFFVIPILTALLVVIYRLQGTFRGNITPVLPRAQLWPF